MTSVLPSFRDFVLKHVHNEDSPDCVLDMFQKHLSNSMKEGLEALKGTGLFRDLYHPLARLRRFDTYLGLTQRGAAGFAQDLRAGRRDQSDLDQKRNTQSTQERRERVREKENTTLSETKGLDGSL